MKKKIKMAEDGNVIMTKRMEKYYKIYAEANNLKDFEMVDPDFTKAFRHLFAYAWIHGKF